MTTSWWGFATSRARASSGLVLTLLALVVVTTAIIAGTVGYSQAAATTSAREALTSGEPTEAAVQVQTRLADDPERQDQLAREVITEAFAPAPVSINRLVVTEPQPVSSGSGAVEGRVVLMGGPELSPGADLDELVTVLEGTWPEPGGTDGALHVDAASVWGVGVGDTLTIEDREVRITATWQPVDLQDGYWFGDQLVATGQVDDDHGPLVVDETVARGVGAPFVRFPVRPDATAASPDDLAVLADGAATLRSNLREVDGLTVRGVTIDGDLAPTAATADTNLATARALGVIPLSVLVLVTGLAVVQLARLLSTTREPQAQLLVARGASRAQILLTGLIESMIVAVVGAVLGGATAWGVMQLVPGGNAATGIVVTVTAYTLLGILLVLAAVATVQAYRLVGGQAVADRSGRARVATAMATVVLVLGAAGLAWWQLDRAGSPLVRGDDGALGTDLVAGAAPALLLAAAAVIALALLGPLSRVVELATRPSRAATGHLASAQVSRRLPVYAVPAVLTVLAVGATTLASLYSGTSALLRDDLADVAEGAPVRADVVIPPVQTGPVVPPPPTDLTGVPEVEDSTLVWHEEGTRLGDVTVPLLMADTDRLRQIVHRPSAAEDGLVPTVLGAPVDPDGAPLQGSALAIAEDATEITVDVRIERDVDKWEVARLNEAAEGHRADIEQFQASLAENEPQLPPGMDRPPEWDLPAEEQVQLLMEQEVSLAAAPEEVEVRLLVQDVGTGIAHTVGPRPVAADGPALTYDPDTLSEFSSEPATTTAELTVTLPEGREHALAAVVVGEPTSTGDGEDALIGNAMGTTEVALSVAAGGEQLLGDATGWGSTGAATPEQAADAIAEAEAVDDPYDRVVVEELDDGSRVINTESNRVSVPPVLESDGPEPEWTLSYTRHRGTPGLEWAISPGATYSGDVMLAGADPVSFSEEIRVPVALTPDAAQAAALTVGDRFALTYAGGAIPALVSAVVPAVPGETSPLAALADSRAMAQVLAGTRRTLNDPAQVWATPSGDAQATVSALAARDDLRAVTGPGTVSVTDATSAARLVFWVASAGAILLALTGIAAVAATLLASRRPEVAVLRALGMPPSAQARSRTLELGGVVLAAIGFGLLAGWLVGGAVVPELASSTTQPGRVTLPAALRPDVVPWVTLVGVVVGALAVLTGALGSRVRGQALDRAYREEIR